MMLHAIASLSRLVLEISAGMALYATLQMTAAARNVLTGLCAFSAPHLILSHVSATLLRLAH